ncbi:sigma-54-dependent Fis family transcriptional regulator [Pantoea sp. 1.19]|uniref:sigma-54-dependent Fis family transcriptional regulator n=1 Tax=Pantoea sp. 1.19 TaxID=1925589 RepID=UPI000948CB35|nr:sigma-54-dependent Fis family transcriptional regulator [Pantoea sp. 1.19]
MSVKRLRPPRAADALADSWSRSQRYGLAPQDEVFPQLPPGQLADVLAQHQQRQQLSTPVMHALASQVADREAVVILSDSAGLVLHTCGSDRLLEKAQRIALAPGNLWSECGRGTNAIGTALALAASCEVRGDQHFLLRNHGLYCAASPLQAPDGSLAGVLDISGPVRFPHPQTLAQVQQAARHIEHLWTKASLRPDQWMMSLHPRQEGLDTPEEALLLFDDARLVAANRVALQWLAIAPAQLGQQTFNQLFPQDSQRASRFPQPLRSRCQPAFWFQLRAPRRRLSAAAAPCSDASPSLPHLPGEDRRVLRLLNAGVSLCMHGETGCGKEYLSRALWQQSRWREGGFVAINCAALPEALIESELFGYQSGAFTGARRQGYIGKIREADGGILFLDEIGDMPLALQTRLLRVLQEKEVSPLGDTRRYRVNFSVICASHRDLSQCVADGRFREDLLWRLQEYRVSIPPLRDWPHLAAFISQLWRELGGPPRGVCLSPALIDVLCRQRWPGNVRQLRSLLTVMLALADDGERLEPHHLPPDYQPATAEAPPVALQQHDDALIAATLQRFAGNVTRAAAALGVARSTLYRRAARRRQAPSGR